ncbi:MAG TPA: iron-sulfur cluster assembly scaffold protein [Anaeromyxobacter sp.]|nr:iron-sulfur cluster assembly scaffold protein [Anaeromyxobacter sp.]
MTSDSLYQEALLRLARAARGAGRLDAPSATGARDNPLCGDDVTIDVSLREGRVAALGHKVRGCVLCQASASVLGAVAPGREPAELAGARAALAAMLREGGGAPGSPWEELAVFLPVRDVPSRHECVLLPFDALGDALARAKE